MKPQFKPIVHWFFGLGYPIIAIIVSVVCLSVHGDYVHSSEALGISSLILAALVIFAIIVLFLGYQPAKQKRMGIASILSIIVVASSIGYTGTLAYDKIIEGVKINLSTHSPLGWTIKISIYDEAKVYSIRQFSNDGWNTNIKLWYVVELAPGMYNLSVNPSGIDVNDYPNSFEVYPQKISNMNIKASRTT